MKALSEYKFHITINFVIQACAYKYAFSKNYKNRNAILFQAMLLVSYRSTVFILLKQLNINVDD